MFHINKVIDLFMFPVVFMICIVTVGGSWLTSLERRTHRFHQNLSISCAHVLQSLLTTHDACLDARTKMGPFRAPACLSSQDTAGLDYKEPFYTLDHPKCVWYSHVLKLLYDFRTSPHRWQQHSNAQRHLNNQRPAAPYPKQSPSPTNQRWAKINMFGGAQSERRRSLPSSSSCHSWVEGR